MLLSTFLNDFVYNKFFDLHCESYYEEDKVDEGFKLTLTESSNENF